MDADVKMLAMLGVSGINGVGGLEGVTVGLGPSAGKLSSSPLSCGVSCSVSFLAMPILARCSSKALLSNSLL